jgi:aspartyl protease family protein
MDDDLLPHLLYSGLFLLFIGAGLWGSYRGRRIQALRHFGIWGAAMLGLTFVYSYRDVFKGAGRRLYAELAPSAPMVGEGGEIAVRRSVGGHFRLDAEVNGASVRFLVDTGASAVILGESAARRAGIRTEGLRYTHRFHTANGIITAAPVTVDIALAGHEFQDVPAFVSAGASDIAVIGMRFLDMFGRYGVEGDTLTLHVR